MKNDRHLFLLLLIFYLILLLLFTLYTYSQVDLNLTLSSNYYYQLIQQRLIQIGYYQRQISGGMFAVLLILLFGVYGLVLKLVKENRLKLIQVRWLIVVTGILLFSYPAFSHDIFNYIFDARVVTKYGLDPNFFKALDFPFDPWVRFMRWTHRYFPYGPLWLWSTLIPSCLGLGKFVLTLFLFKFMFLSFHLINVLLVGKVLNRVFPKHTLFGVAYFALNPLVLIESLVSPHNEVMMTSLVLISIYLLLTKRQILSVILLILSIAVKFVSFVLLPAFLFIKNTKYFFIMAYLLWVCVVIMLTIFREPYPWYFLPLLGLAALNTRFKIIWVVTLGVSAGVTVRYLPFLIYGDYSFRTIYYEQWGMIIVSVIGTFLAYVTLTKRSFLTH